MMKHFSWTKNTSATPLQKWIVLWTKHLRFFNDFCHGKNKNLVVCMKMFQHHIFISSSENLVGSGWYWAKTKTFTGAYIKTHTNIQKLPGLDASFIISWCTLHKLLEAVNIIYLKLQSFTSENLVQEGRQDSQTHEACTHLYLKTPLQKLMQTRPYIDMYVARRAKLKPTHRWEFLEPTQ